MNKKIVLFILLSFIPIFLQLIVQPYGNRFVYISFFLLILSLFMSSFNLSKLDIIYRKIMIINFLMVIIILYQMFVFHDFSSVYWKIIIPYILTSILILFFNKKEEIIHQLLILALNILIISFIIQFLLSIVEAFNGSFIVSQYNIWLTSYSYKLQENFSNRFIIGIPVNINPFSYLKIGLSGLYGQHNMWAMQLPFFNLIFAFMYVKTKNINLISILILVALAQLLNTTRTGIFAILLTDFVIYLKYFYKKKLLLNILLSSIILAIVVIGYEGIYNYFYRYFSSTDTFTIRTEIYKSGIDYLFKTGSLLFTGIGYLEMGKLVTFFLSLQNYNVELKSFENGFMDIIFLYGIIGFCLFIFLIKIFLSKSYNEDTSFFTKLLVLNIFILSMTLSHIYHLHVYPYVIFSLLLFKEFKNPQTFQK